MKASTLSIFVILALVFGACSEDEKPGNFIDTIKSYSGSEFIWEKKFVYDNDGRIARTILRDNDGDEVVSEFVYDGNLLTVNENQQYQYVLKFENEQLVKYIGKLTVNNVVYKDSISFSYESGKLKTILHHTTEYDVLTDDRDNITTIPAPEDGSGNGLHLLFTYDKVSNPFKNIPSGFFNFSMNEAQKNQLVFPNLVRYFSSNNALRLSDILMYRYRDGKVSEVVHSYYCQISSCNITQKISYRDL